MSKKLEKYREHIQVTDGGKFYRLDRELKEEASNYLNYKVLDFEIKVVGGKHRYVIWLKLEKPDGSSITIGQKKSSPKKSHSTNPSSEGTKAPYNFVPLNLHIVQHEAPPSADRFHDGRLTGYITFELTNKTPFFIRGRDYEKRGGGHRWIPGVHFFHAVENQPIVPGSSMRGMIRSLVEIISMSQLKFTDRNTKYKDHSGKPFRYSIGDMIHQIWIDRNGQTVNKEVELWDFASALFGDVDERIQRTTKGRVFFEDAHLISDHDPMDKYATKTLLGPEPKSARMYLKQKKGTATEAHERTSWNTKNGRIRGIKQYWHRDTPESGRQSWVDESRNLDDPTGSTEQDPIVALRANHKFKARIRFENLTEIELGCILAAIDLPEGHFHKLGAAKPLGLGSIHLSEVKAILTKDRKTRYSQMFSNEGWHTADSPIQPARLKEYKEKFVAHIQGTSDRVRSEHEKILKVLYKFLEWGNQDEIWLNRTAYESSNKGKPILPFAKDVQKT
jgi:CRISPR/Cas system CSM-associated protein Csm3 (group 7 of RAMP superfamily)